MRVIAVYFTVYLSYRQKSRWKHVILNKHFNTNRLTDKHKCIIYWFKKIFNCFMIVVVLWSLPAWLITFCPKITRFYVWWLILGVGLQLQWLKLMQLIISDRLIPLPYILRYRNGHVNGNTHKATCIGVNYFVTTIAKIVTLAKQCQKIELPIMLVIVDFSRCFLLQIYVVVYEDLTTL